MMQPAGSDAERAFVEEYGRMGEMELLKLAGSYDTLVEPAQDALRAEFARRKMEPPLVDEPDVLESRSLVTIRRYRDIAGAMVPRAVLESAGIFCFLQDENVVRLDWAWSNAVGGVRLQVRREDAPAAEELLNQPMPESIGYGSQMEYVQPHCPRCESIDIAFEGADRSAALVSTFVLGLPLPLGGESWRCSACGCRWSDDGEDDPAQIGE